MTECRRDLETCNQVGDQTVEVSRQRLESEGLSADAARVIQEVGEVSNGGYVTCPLPPKCSGPSRLHAVIGGVRRKSQRRAGTGEVQTDEQNQSRHAAEVVAGE